MTRVAAFDCGTNSLRLLIAELDAETGSLTDVDRRMEIVRLGEDVDRTGRLAPQALERTFKVTRFFAELCREAAVERMRFVATSATRDATNRNEFVAGIRELLGVDPEVVAGQQEAALSFSGATRELQDGHPSPFAVVDIGGGSTEVIVGGASGSGGTSSISVDIGSVRITERHLAADPPTPAQLAAAQHDIDTALDDVATAVPLAQTRTLIGVAGSVTTITAHALRLEAYDAASIHRVVLPVDQVRAACDDLLRLGRAERAALPYLHPGRVDIIAAGALIWRGVIDQLVALAGITEVVTSEHDILDGIAWSLA